MKRHYFSVLFFIKKTKLLKTGEAPVCLRVTVDGRRAEIQIKRSVSIDNWNCQKECAIGKDMQSRELNHYLEIVRSKVLRIHRELEQDNKPITANLIINTYNGKSESVTMLLPVFGEHNKKCRELIGKDYVLTTVLRYERTVKYLSEFLKLYYKMSDIPLKNIDNAFVVNFEHFLKVHKKCAQNATVKYLKNLKKIINFALVNKWMDNNPFAEMRFHQTKSNREFLVEEEISALIQKELSISRLDTVRDIFIFCDNS
jgi:hypothetical protein